MSLSDIPTAPSPEAHSEGPNQRADDPVVLVVDDRPQSRVQIGRALSKWGIATLEAADGDEGFGLYREQGPSAVVTDMRMPVADGMGLLQRIARESDTPVFCITARPDWESSAAAIKRGARDYYQWPRDLDRLVADVAECVQARSSVSGARQKRGVERDRERSARLRALIDEEGGNITRIADRLEVDRKTVYAWMRRYGIRIRD